MASIFAISDNVMSRCLRKEEVDSISISIYMSRCLRKPTEGGAVDAESFGFPKLSLFSAAAAALSLSTIQPRSCFTPLSFLYDYSGGCVVDARSKVLMSGTRLEPH